jgi:peptide/nickel transport system permease protein
MGSRRYLLSKTLQAVVTLWFVLTFNFLLFRVLPGDPVALLARSEKLTPDDVARLQHDLGLDLPMVEQYAVYLRETLTGNLGESLTSGIPVSDLIRTRIGPTALLVGLGTILSAWLGVVIGIRGGWRRGSTFDTTSQYGSLILYAMPEGWLGMLLLLLFSGLLHWFPAGGYRSSTSLTGAAKLTDILDHLFLPLLTLTLGYIGSFSIVMRASMIDTIAEDYVQTARAKGVPDRLVRSRHVVPNAFLPAFTLIILSFGFVLGGAIVIETVFSWPGLGLLTYQSINTLDYPVIQGVFLIASAAVIVANLVADVTYGYLDPRIRAA